MSEGMTLAEYMAERQPRYLSLRQIRAEVAARRRAHEVYEKYVMPGLIEQPLKGWRL